LLPFLGLAVIVLFVVAGIMSEAPGSRRGRWVPLVYYYLATVVGLVLVLTGLIGGLNGVVTAVAPRTADPFLFFEPPFDPEGRPIELSPREEAKQEADALDRARQSGIAGAIRGGSTAVVGFPVFFWHLRQARRKEPEWLGPAPSSGST
jgi:hypothetical protein